MTRRGKAGLAVLLWARVTAALSLAGCLCACSSEGSADWAGLYEIAKSSFSNPDGLTLNQVAAIPYASLGVSVGGNRQTIAILATDDGAQKLWAVGNKIAFVTVDGRIQRTVGLDYNLFWSTMASGNGAPAPAEQWLRPRRVIWTADFRDIGQFSLQVICDERPTGDEQINVLGQQISVLRIDARCESPRNGWKFENIYWIDRSDGTMWRSIQNIHPNLGAITLETFRPPG